MEILNVENMKSPGDLAIYTAISQLDNESLAGHINKLSRSKDFRAYLDEALANAAFFALVGDIWSQAKEDDTIFQTFSDILTDFLSGRTSFQGFLNVVRLVREDFDISPAFYRDIISHLSFRAPGIKEYLD